MKKYILPLIAALILIPNFVKAQTSLKPAEDENAIKLIIKNLADAWAAGDGKKWADQFTDDVDYTVWNGRYLTGREENRRGHQQLFDTIYKDSTINPEIIKIRFLRDDVAVVHLKSGNRKNGKQLEDVPLVRPLLVLSKEQQKWRIVVLQNTPVIYDGELSFRGGQN